MDSVNSATGLVMAYGVTGLYMIAGLGLYLWNRYRK